MRRVTLSAVTLIGVFQAEAQTPRVGFHLRPGMQLIYSSDESESPPWIIDSLSAWATAGRHNCLRIRLRASPNANLETRSHCTDSATMFNWDERAGVLRPARPLRPGASLEVRQASGTMARFETGAIDTEQIPIRVGANTTSTLPVEILETVVTTTDSTGRVVRRLRERFSAGLATATGGVFEVPDTTQQTGWRVVRRFELIAIRMP